MTDTLNSDQIDRLLSTHPGWTLSDDGLAVSTTIEFANFVEAWGFMSEIAIEAENTPSGVTSTTESLLR